MTASSRAGWPRLLRAGRRRLRRVGDAVDRCSGSRRARLDVCDIDRAISLVVAVCSSTAEAIVVWMSSISAIIATIWPIAVDGLRGVAWMASIRALMSLGRPGRLPGRGP